MRSWGWIPNDETSALIGETPRELPGPFLQVGTLGEVGHLGTRKPALRLRICQYFGLGLPEPWKISISYFINHSVCGIFVIVIQTILSPHDMKSRLIAKDPDAGKDWRQEEKGTTEDEMVGWHHWLNRHEFEQTLGDSEGQGSLTSCSPWGREELDTTFQLNNSNNPKTGCIEEDLSGQLFLVQRCSRKNCLAPEKHGYVVSCKKDQSLDRKEHRDTLFKTLGVQGVGEDLGYSVVRATK